jgi:hypothetical protein
MAQVVILGGYGRAGRACAQEIAEQTRARLVIAGPSIQKAESAALGLGGGATAAYGDVSDPRSLARLLEGARLLVACCADLQPGVLEIALELRVALIAVSSLELGEARWQALAEQAWRAQVPAIVHAGAIPGLPGVLADWLVRRFAALAELRLASTGAWTGSACARRERGRVVGLRRAALRLPQRFRFDPPLGSLAMRGASSADLEGFARAHCVERLLYLEPLLGATRRARRAVQPGFSLVAEARVRAGRRAPDARAAISAPDPLAPAAALCGSLAAAVLAGEVPAGLLTPREARGPAALLNDLEKRGVGVRLGG